MDGEAQRILAAIRAKGCETHGSDDGEFRHAVHEAVHGIRLKVPKWKNEAIHRACMRVRPADRLMEELIARAVEQLACARVGATCDTVEHFAFWTCMEASKNGVNIGSIADISAGVKHWMTDTRIVAPLVEQILAMGGAP